MEDRRIEPVIPACNHLFKYMYMYLYHALPRPLSEKPFPMSMIMSSVTISKGAVWEGLTVMLYRCTGWLDSVHAKSNV